MCDTLKYNAEDEITFFLGPTNIQSDSSSIYCEKGWFNASTDESVFSKNAIINNQEQEIKGDSIYYNKATSYGEIFGKVSLKDTTNKLLLTGDYAWYNDKDSTTLITGKALLTQNFGSDTFFLHADTLFAGYDSTGTNKELFAYNHVQFFKEDMQGRCDSLKFSDADSTIKMFNGPTLWNEENQITGTMIKITQYDEEIKFLDIESNAFIASKVDSLKFNQIKGISLLGTFEQNDLSKVFINDNGQTIYYAKSDSNFIGMNKTICENMIMYLDSNTVSKITFLSKPEATLYPFKDINPENSVLEGFIWKDAIRPKDKLDIFYWKEDL